MNEQNDRADEQHVAGEPNQENPRGTKRPPGQQDHRQDPRDKQSDLPEAAKDLSRPQHDLTEDESEEKTP